MKIPLKPITALLLAVYFLTGAILLPGGETEDLLAIPDLYRHAHGCNPESVTPLTFIRDHLLNIDRMVAGHQQSDHAKPDKLSDLSHHHIPGLFLLKPESVLPKPTDYHSRTACYLSPFHPKITQSPLFRPPSFPG